MGIKDPSRHTDWKVSIASNGVECRGISGTLLSLISLAILHSHQLSNFTRFIPLFNHHTSPALTACSMLKLYFHHVTLDHPWFSRAKVSGLSAREAFPRITFLDRTISPLSSSLGNALATAAGLVFGQAVLRPMGPL